jgi:hypothetical protein
MFLRVLTAWMTAIMGAGGNEMTTTVQKPLTRIKTILILVFVAIDMIAVSLVAIPLIASILGRIAN